MKKMLKILLGSLVVSLFAGCAQGGLHKQVDPEWKTPPSGLTVYVLDLKVQNGNDFNKALPNYVGKFNDWFLPQLNQNMVSMSGLEVSIIPEVSRSGNFTRTKKSMKGYMDFMVSNPNPEKLPDLKGLVVTISGLTFNRHVSVKRHNGNKVYLYGVQAYAGYTIYSMDSKKEVAFGKIDILEESEDFVPGEDVWTRLTRRISNEILAETPLIRQL